MELQVIENLRSLTIKSKLSVIILLSIIIITVTIIGILGFKILNINEQNKENYIHEAYLQKETYLKNNVDLAISILKEFKAKSNSSNEEQMKKEALKIIEGLRYGKSGYFWINDMQSRMIMHPIKPSLNGKDLSDFKDPNGMYLFNKMVEVCQKDGGGIVKYQWPKPGSKKPVDKYSYVELFTPWGMVVGTGDYVTDVESKIVAYNEKVKETITQDFMNITILSFVLIIISLVVILKIIDYLINKPLRYSVDTISDSTNKITSSSQSLSNSAVRLSNMSATQSASVEEITATIEQTSQNVNANFKSIEELTSYDANMQQKANSGYEYMLKLKDSMEDISQSSKNINALVNTIDEIAFQTNLLSLNAAVEAARAGEHGVGFAVVAEEVRSLASRSASEAVKIHHVIEKSVEESENGLEVAMKTNKAFDEILDNIKSSIMIRENTSSSAREQKNAIDQLKQAILEVDKITQELSLNSKDMSQMAINLSHQIEDNDTIVNNISKMIS
jgi:methyl-accepting chemotaxis protein